MLSLRARVADLLLALAVLGACAVLYVQTFSMPPPIIRGYPGIAFFPRLVIYFLAAMCLVILVRSLVRRPRAEEEYGFEVAQVGVTLAYMLAYIFALPLIGFEITTFVLLSMLLWTRLERQAWIPVWSAATVIVLYLAFVVLMNVDLPLLFLPRYVSF